MTRPVISIIAPMYNESELVEEYCHEIAIVMTTINDKYNYEVILVNDGSKDDTLSLIKVAQENDPEHITVVSLSRNFGLEGAVYAGLRKALGDIIIVMDADLQDPPNVILKMIKSYEQGAQIVTAVRQKRESDSFFKKTSAKMYYRIIDELSGKVKIQKNAANFRLITKPALKILLGLPEVNAVFRVIVPYIGMKTDEVYYDRDKRFAGKTNYTLKNMIPYALDSITGISVVPLRKMIWCIFFCCILLIAFIALFFIDSDNRMFYMLGALVSMISVLLFTCIYIIGEYLAQVMTEVKGRPTSIVAEYMPAQSVQGRIGE